MRAQSTLPPAPRAHDLPPRWDGLAVAWDDWEVGAFSSAEFHIPPECCRACGSMAPPVRNRGTVCTRRPAWTAGRRRPASALRDQEAALGGVLAVILYVWRCSDCRHDVVTEVGSGAVWDLDDTDYTDIGSMPPSPRRKLR